MAGVWSVGLGLLCLVLGPLIIFLGTGAIVDSLGLALGIAGLGLIMLSIITALRGKHHR